MPPRLVLAFLGLPQVHLDDNPIATDRRKAIALLAYLAVSDRGHSRQNYSRESLSALFWPEYEQAKAFSNLRRTIWEIHRALGEGWLIAERGSVHLHEDARIDLDVARFLDSIAQARQHQDVVIRVPYLSDAVKLYRNHFLTGFSLKDAYPFNEWAFAESEELRHKLAEALTMLVESHCALKQADLAIPYARRLITLDPFNESAHRQLMEVYLQAGQHSAALKQYQTCEQMLRKNLNLDPQAETRTLYKKIRKGEIKPVQVVKPSETATPKHNLPSQLSTFIGREKEQGEMINLIAKNRLVTLLGVGGIGKTRLALQVGQKRLNNYLDGVWFIPLDALSNPTLIPQAIASVFDVRERPDHPIIEILINVLREKTVLLILDNCEHLLDACAQLIKTLLTNCPNLKVLVTSRETLNMEGEAIYSLPSLSLPEQEISPEQVFNYDSIQLFIERASLAISSFKLTQENLPTIIEICQRLDAIPLGIELAAARLDVLQLSEILKQLNEHFDLLARHLRPAIPRHQTMRASLDWSWGLLTTSEQTFMRHLSVFAGGWTLEAAQVVCDGDALNSTSVLVKKSLIAVDQEAGGETRYHFHEIVRQYTYEKLIEAGEEKQIRSRHLHHFLHFSEQAETAVRGPSQMTWYARLNDERENIRVALEWAEQMDVQAGLYLSSRLDVLWENFDIREQVHWLEVFTQKPESKAYPHARAKALRTLGLLRNWLERIAEALSDAQECLSLYRACGDKSGELDALLLLILLVNPSETGELRQQALTLTQSIKDKWRTAHTFYVLSWGYHDRHSYIEKALALFQEIGALRDIAECLAELGRFETLGNDLESAQKRLKEAIYLFRQLNIKNGISDILQAYGRIAAVKGDYEQAYSNFQESAALSEQGGYRISYLFTRSHLGYLALQQERITEAHEIFNETLRSFFDDKNEIGVAFNLEGIAGLSVAVGKYERAARLIGWADALRERIGDPRPPLEQADVDKIIAACLVKMGEAAFSNAYEIGHKMSLDEAAAYALERS